MCDALLTKKKQKKWFFFHHSILFRYISFLGGSFRNDLAAQCANCLVQFCWISCSLHSDSFNTNTYSSAALISNAVFGSNIICTFCFYSFHSCIFPQTLRNEQSLFVVDWKSSQLIISVIAWPRFDVRTVRVLQRQWDSVMMQSIAFARG